MRSTFGNTMGSLAAEKQLMAAWDVDHVGLLQMERSPVDLTCHNHINKPINNPMKLYRKQQPRAFDKQAIKPLKKKS